MASFSSCWARALGRAALLLPAAWAVAHWYRRRRQRTGLIFTGTGCSSTLPILRCAIDASAGCACAVALRRGRCDPNWRGNVGAVVRFHGPDGRLRHLQIDVGKSWRESAVHYYRRYHIQHLDAVLLTHEHADASLGLDDLRSLQMKSAAGVASSSIPVYADLRSLKKLRVAFPYLFPSAPQIPGLDSNLPGGFALMCACCEGEATPDFKSSVARETDPVALKSATALQAVNPTDASRAIRVVRFVAKLEWRCYGADVSAGVGAMSSSASTRPFDVAGLQVTPLPVMHGEDYVSYGFGFGDAGKRVVYLSDYTRLLPETVEVLQRWSQPGEMLPALPARAHLAESHEGAMPWVDLSDWQDD
eukprot:scaffold39538_cov31-Tisochrysis_lutea.AAC.1